MSNVYIVQTGGRPVAVIKANTMADAEKHTRSMGFQISVELQVLGGRFTDPIVVREGTPEEKKRWGFKDHDMDLECLIGVFEKTSQPNSPAEASPPRSWIGKLLGW